MPLAIGLGEVGSPRELAAREAALLSALEAIGAAGDRAFGEIEPRLRLRYARVLLDQGRPDEAAAQARIVLEDLDGEGTVDLDRSASAARAILAHALLGTDPAEAARTAVVALRDLSETDAPQRRASLIMTLVLALGAAGMPTEADYAAERLASLHRSIREERARVRPMLIVAAQRASGGRDDAALRALAEVRRIIRFARDHRSELTVEQLTAMAHERAGRIDDAVAALEAAARIARWLADDLLATPHDRAVHMLAELDARSHALRLALDAGDPVRADAQARAILDRIEPRGGRPVLDAVSVWDRAIDATIGRMLATGLVLAAGSDADAAVAATTAEAGSPAAGEASPLRPNGRAGRRGAASAEPTSARYDRRRAEAQRLIDRAPAGHEERAAYWSAYLVDRDAAMLEARGETARALDQARRAVELWREAGDESQVPRLEEQIRELEAGADGDA